MADPDVPADFTACPYWGQGGRYVVDPATGLRTPVNEAPAAALPASAAPLEPNAKKGK